MICKALFTGGLLWVVALLGCGAAQYALVGTAHVSGAHGDVQLERASEGGTMATVIMDQLPPPSELDKETYVLWFDADGEDPQNMGALAYDDKTRQAKATGTSAHRDFEIIITAEDSAEAEELGDLVIARKQIEGK